MGALLILARSFIAERHLGVDLARDNDKNEGRRDLLHPASLSLELREHARPLLSPQVERAASLEPFNEKQDQTYSEAGDRDKVGSQKRYVLPPEDAREACA
jgi:hypothetical protein